jgi:hypothetical protein
VSVLIYLGLLAPVFSIARNHLVVIAVQVTGRLKELRTTIEAGDMHRQSVLMGVAASEWYGLGWYGWQAVSGMGGSQ